MDYLNNIPLISAIVLGLLTAINPCHLAVNIMVEGYFSNESHNRKTLILKSLIYIFTRIITYIAIAYVAIIIIKQGLTTDKIQHILGEYGELTLGPILILFGIIILISERSIFTKEKHNHSHTHKRRNGTIGIILLAIITTFAFCPETALLFFGIMIPLSISTQYGYILPIIYAFSTMLPTIGVALILDKLSKYQDKIEKIQKYTTLFVAIAFIVIGIYITIENTIL